MSNHRAAKKEWHKQIEQAGAHIQKIKRENMYASFENQLWSLCERRGAERKKIREREKANQSVELIVWFLLIRWLQFLRFVCCPLSLSFIHSFIVVVLHNPFYPHIIPFEFPRWDRCSAEEQRTSSTLIGNQRRRAITLVGSSNHQRLETWSSSNRQAGLWKKERKKMEVFILHHPDDSLLIVWEVAWE